MHTPALILIKIHSTNRASTIWLWKKFKYYRTIQSGPIGGPMFTVRKEMIQNENIRFSQEFVCRIFYQEFKYGVDSIEVFPNQIISCCWSILDMLGSFN